MVCSVVWWWVWPIGVIKSGRRIGIVFVRLVRGKGMDRRRRLMMKRRKGRMMLMRVLVRVVLRLRLILICIRGASKTSDSF